MSIVVNGRFLRRVDPTGLQVVARELLSHLISAGAPVEVLAPPGVRDPSVSRTTGRTPRSRMGDLVWEQTALPHAAGTRAVLSLANTAPVLARRSVVTVYDTSWAFDPRRYRPSMRLYSGLVMSAAKHANAVVTPSSFSASELRRAGVAAVRISVIPCAVEDGWGPASATDVEEMRGRLGIVGPYLLVVGWASPNRNIEVVLRAHAKVLRESPHQLVLVGPEKAPTWHDRRRPILETVNVVGYTSRATLRALYTGAHALLHPSRYEGFGIPPLEAMACGTPAIVSDLPVLRESSHGQAVFVALDDVEGWERNMLMALRGEVRGGVPPAWSWAQAANLLAEVLRPLE